MTDPIAVLQRAADQAAAGPVLAPDAVRAVRARVERRRGRRRVQRAAAAAAAVLVAVAAVALTTGGEEGSEGVVVSPTPDPPPPASADEGPLEPSPLSPRRQVAMAPAGDEVLVWGGIGGLADPLSDGAAYDRAERRWRTVSASPLAERDDEGMAPVAAPTGDDDVVVARGRAVAVWDATTDAWRALDDAPAPVADLTGVGDGLLASFGAGAVLDVASGRWEQPQGLPPFDLSPTTAVTWTGTELVGVGTSPDGPPDRPHGLALDPAVPAWREIALPPEGTLGGAGLAAAWDGERVVVTDAEMAAAAYDPATDSWEQLADVPARFVEHHPSSASVGGVTVTSMARTLAVLDGARQVWTPFPSPNPNDGGGPPGRWLVPLDDRTLAVWVDDAGPGEADLVVFDPTLLAGRDRRRQVGVASVEAGADEHVAGSSVSDAGVVAVDLLATDGHRCRVTSGLGLPQGDAQQRAVREEVPTATGGRALTWFHDTGGTRWEVELGDADLLVVDCDDPLVARRLVASVRLT